MQRNKQVQRSPDFFEPTYSVACDPTEPAYPTGTLYQILYSTQKTESKAAYAQMDWSVTDRWTLTGGVRYTEEEKDFYAGQAYLAGHDQQDKLDQRRNPSLLQYI